MPQILPPLSLRGGEEGLFFPLFAALLFVSHPIQTQAVTYIVQRLASLATLFYLLSLVMYIKWRLTTQQSVVSSQESGQKIWGNPPIPPLSKGGESTPQTLPPLRVRGGEEGLLERQEAVVGSQKSEVGAEKPKTEVRNPKSGWRSAVWYLSSLISAVLAMKTKEIAFTLPLVIALYEFLFFTGHVKKRILYLLPLLLTMLIIPLELMGLERPVSAVMGEMDSAVRASSDMSRLDYLFTQFRVIVTYIRLLFLPVDQNLDYDYPVYHSFFDPNVFLSFLFLLALFGTGVYLLYRSRTGVTPPSPQPQGKVTPPPSAPPLKLRGGRGSYGLWVGEEGLPAVYFRLMAFGIFWFFITLSVESSIIPITDVIFEHRLYLPSVGFFIAVTAGLFVVWRRFIKRIIHIEKIPPSLPLPKGGISPSLAKRGEGRFSEKCQSNYELPENDAIKRQAKIAMAVFGLIIVILSGATYARNNLWLDEVSFWQDVIKKSPSKIRGRINLGYAYSKQGRFDEAIREFQAAIKLDPDDYQLYNNLGVAYKGQGRYEEAIKEFQNALRLKPDDGLTYYNLGNIFREQGAFEEAVKHYQVATRLEPYIAVINNNLGIAYIGLGKVKEAEREFRTALDIDPKYEAARGNLEMLLRGGGR